MGARTARRPARAEECEPAASRRLSIELGRLITRPLRLVLTENRSSMVFVRRRPEGLDARVQQIFAGAPLPVVRALANYIETADSQASRLLGRYIRAHQHRIGRPGCGSAAAVGLRARGRVFDLAAVLADLNQRYFDGRLRARIAWGQKPSVRARRSRRLGTYSVEDRLIRIHPCLDRPFVPRFFLESVVFHEMLHQRHEIRRHRGRRRFHSREFLAEERAFPDYQLAKRWERENIDRLLSD